MSQKEFSKIILTITAGIILLSGISLLVLRDNKSVPINKTSDSQKMTTYRNNRIGYLLTIPPGYHLATEIMKFANTTGLDPIQNYTAENAEYVMLTKASIQEETSFVNKLRKESGGDTSNIFSISTELSGFAPSSTIEIYPISISIETIKSFAERLGKSGKRAPSDFRDIRIGKDIAAVRYTERTVFDDFILFMKCIC